MEFSKVLENRFSVRDYKDLPVENDKIEAIVKAGMEAPTARNTQCEKIYVLKSQEAIKKIREITPCAFNAPVVILTCGDVDEQCLVSITGRSLMDTDVAIIKTHMMLKATELGLGTCWIGRFDPQKVYEVLQIPSNQIPYGILIMGYPSDTAMPSPMHDKRLEVEEFTTEI